MRGVCWVWLTHVIGMGVRCCVLSPTQVYQQVSCGAMAMIPSPYLGLEYVRWHETVGLLIASVRYENGTGGSSDSCSSSPR